MGNEVGRHDFAGACVPGGISGWSGQRTFSVGIFRWIPTANGKSRKKSAVGVRVSGSCSDPELVYAKAREIVAALDAGTYHGPKSVVLKACEQRREETT